MEFLDNFTTEDFSILRGVFIFISCLKKWMHTKMVKTSNVLKIKPRCIETQKNLIKCQIKIRFGWSLPLRPSCMVCHIFEGKLLFLHSQTRCIQATIWNSPGQLIVLSSDPKYRLANWQDPSHAVGAKLIRYWSYSSPVYSPNSSITLGLAWTSYYSSKTDARNIVENQPLELQRESSAKSNQTGNIIKSLWKFEVNLKFRRSVQVTPPPQDT